MTRLFLWCGAVVAAAVFVALGHPVMAAIVVGAAAGVSCRLERGPRWFPGWMRRQLFLRDGGRCVYCGRAVHFAGDCPLGGCDADFEADHVQAWANGGRTTVANAATACRGCNRAKGAS